MAVSLGEFANYLVPGLKTLSTEELGSLPNALSLINLDNNKFKGTVEDYIKPWKLYEKVVILTKGIQAKESNPNFKRMQWGRMLMHFYSENLQSGSYIFSDLAQSNNALIADIEKDYIRQDSLLSELQATVGNGIDLDAILSNPDIMEISEKFTIAEGLLSVVENNKIGTFIKNASRVSDSLAQIGTLNEIIDIAYGVELSVEEGYKIVDIIDENFPNKNPITEYVSNYISGLWLYQGPNKNDKNINDLIRKSVPRLIEDEGYLKLEKFLNSSVPKELNNIGEEDLYAVLEEKLKQEEYVKPFYTIEGDIYYLLEDKLGNAKEFTENFITEYTMSDKQKIKLQSQEHEQRLTNLVHLWKSGDYDNAQKVGNELENAGFHHWSINLFLASSNMGAIVNSEPNRDFKKRIKSQLQIAMDEYMKSLDMGGNIPKSLYQIADNDIQSLRRFAANAQSEWGVNDNDVVYIRKRANMLERELRQPGFFENIKNSLSNVLHRDKIINTVIKAIRE